MNRSLQRHLSLALGAAIVLSGVLAAAASFVLAYADAKEFQDDMLRQIAVLSARTPVQPVELGADAVPGGDPEVRVLVVRLPEDPRPPWLPDELAAGFHTVVLPGEDMRIYVQGAPGGHRTVVVQPTDARDESAVNSALRTLIPLLLLIPLLAWLIVRIVQREFAPVAQLARRLDAQAADRPGPIGDEGVPTEIVPFVQAIDRLLERANALMGQQQRFIADAAHELRSPLTALSIQARNLRQADSLPAMQERIVPLQAGIERARQLTEQLLSLAKSQAGRTDEEVVDLSELARELIADRLPVAEATRIDLGLDESGRLSLRTSPALLRLILGNALDNAMKNTPARGRVTLRLSEDGGCAVVEVIDAGPGILASERERVFDAFYRVPGSAGTGSGLGLAIAREAAARLGGDVSLRDRPGGPGLIFSYRQRLRPE